MGFRIVVVNSRAKLETRLNFLVVRGEVERKIYINEINTLIIQSTAVAITASLLSVLIANNVKIIFCDEKCNPQSELIPYRGAHNTTKRYRWQFGWNDRIKAAVWQDIIKKKISNQARVLTKLGFEAEADLLKAYVQEVEPNDVSNREGHAAKVYFNCILPEGVSRRSGGFINTCLNYGYAVLLSAFNREIVAAGLLTQIGIWHNNEFNAFNLASDLMEPFRTIIDETVLSFEDAEKDFKRRMANVLNYEVIINGQKTTLDIAIRNNVRSIINAIDAEDVSLILYPEIVIYK